MEGLLINAPAKLLIVNAYGTRTQCDYVDNSASFVFHLV